jgi:serine/threonine-protein kinase
MSERHLTRIGKYEVECVIGEGSMGVVYRAMDPLINRRVAIKVMNDAVAQDVALRERFLREAQTAGSLQHPNVVTVYDFGEVDDHLFIAMEYVEGNDLADLLQKDVSIPTIEALDLIIGLLHGLAYAHKRGITHRDIKPANIRVDVEGKARLMDFGVAHLASSDMTSTGMLLGTPAYMAPEQITGGAVTAETDIFSVGAVLYELLAGRRPFTGDTLQSLMYSILNRTPESLEAIAPKIPIGLHDIVMRALQKEPSQRYHSAMAMANDLAAIRDSLDPEGKRTSLSLRATIDSALAHESRARDRRKRGWQVAVAAGAVVFVIASIVVARLVLLRGIPVASKAAPTTTAVSTQNPPPPDSAAGAPAPAAAAPVVTPEPRPVRDRVGAPPPSSPPQPTASRAQAEGGARSQHLVKGAAAPRVDSAAAVGPVTAQRETLPNARTPAVTQQQQASTSVAVPTPAPAPAIAPAPRENASEQIAAVVAAYARALESLDLNELRRVYPAMTTQQRSAFDDFFRSIRSLKATLGLSNLQVDGASAEGQVAGAFDYVTSRGADERRSVSFNATFRRERGTWSLTAVH